MVSLKKYACTILLIASSFIAHSQGFGGNMQERKGTNVAFYLNTISNIENGITYSNYTEFKIDFIDSIAIPDVDGFALYVYSALTTLEADYGATNLDLNKIKLSASDTDGGTCLVDTALSITPIPICSWNTIADDTDHSTTVRISYECKSLKNMESDYFSTILIFELRTFVGTP